MNSCKPIYLFADSQLLFWKDGSDYFIRRFRGELETDSPKAAYLGASNNDEPAFHEIFKAAMEQIGISQCRMISSCFPDADREFIEQADIILLAGGDFELGWKVFNAVGLKDIIIKRYYDGALLTAVSAGAMQLGMGGCLAGNNHSFLETFKLIPFTIGVHEERNEWHGLMRAIRHGRNFERGIGLPTGGGMIYHQDHTIEPIRNCLYEFTLVDGALKSNLLYPNADIQ